MPKNEFRKELRLAQFAFGLPYAAATALPTDWGSIDTSPRLSKNAAVPVPHHPFYYRRIRHGFHRREYLLMGFWIVSAFVFALVALLYLINFLVM